VTFGCRLWDLRRLVADDTPGVIEALGRLRNTRYHDRPVSLYGGMVELPLIVTRDDGARWFADRDLLTSGRLWAERDADLRVDTQRLARELPDNLFGREVWAMFETATRTLAMAVPRIDGGIGRHARYAGPIQPFPCPSNRNTFSAQENLEYFANSW
jgi:hypothetical protein